MEGSKLIILLKTFKKSEWKQFKAFLASPYFNKRADLLDFFNYLEKVNPDFSEKKLKKEYVFQQLFPEKTYDDKHMRYLMNYTLKLAEHFLGQQKLEQSAILESAILEELVDRKLEKHSKNYFEKIAAQQESVQEKSDAYYYIQYRLAHIANKHFNNQNLRKDDGNLELASNNLDLFYFYHKLKYSCEMLNRQKVFSASYDLSFTNLLYDYLEKRGGSNEALVAIYFQIYTTLTKTDASKNFELLKQLINDYSDEISPIEKRHIYLYAINYCLSQMKYNVQKEYYAGQCLDLYLEGIEQEFLFINGYLSPWTFKNVVKIGFNLKKYDWTEQFIQDYYKKLSSEFQDDALHYNLADLYYRKKNYKQAQYHLVLVEYSDLFYSIDAKAMLLKIYFETNEEEALFSLLASFSIYLKRNKKISNNWREIYLNFTSFLYQISKAKKKNIADIKAKINQTGLLTNRSWLLRICEELEK